MKSLILLLLSLVFSFFNIASAESTTIDLTPESFRSYFAAAYPEAALQGYGRLVLSNPAAIVAVYDTTEHHGAAIFMENSSDSFDLVCSNDQLFEKTDTSFILLCGWPEDNPTIAYESDELNYELRISLTQDDTWYISRSIMRKFHPAYNRYEQWLLDLLNDSSSHKLEIIITSLGELGPVNIRLHRYPNIDWPLALDMAFASFDPQKALFMGELAMSYLYNEYLVQDELNGCSSYDYPVHQWPVDLEE